MTEPRRLKSYDDIADYIIEHIRLNTVDTLPDMLFDAFGKYHFHYQVILPVNSMYIPVVVFEYTPPNKLDIVFKNGQGDLIQRVSFVRPVEASHGIIRTFGTHDSSGREIP